MNELFWYLMVITVIMMIFIGAGLYLIEKDQI